MSHEGVTVRRLILDGGPAWWMFAPRKAPAVVVDYTIVIGEGGLTHQRSVLIGQESPV
jgi:hypothetical protein